MSIIGDFDADTVEPSTGFDPVPAGKYKVVIAASEEKKTKKGDGSYLQLEFVVIDGEYKNRKLWARLNLNNPNDQAVSIARAELSAICRAVNVRKIKDSSQLHDIPLVVRVAAKPDDKGEMRNEIKGYEAVGTAVTTSPIGNSSNAASPPPWAKKS